MENKKYYIKTFKVGETCSDGLPVTTFQQTFNIEMF